MTIADARPPHFLAGDEPRSEPAAVFTDAPLRLEVELSTSVPLASPTEVEVTATGAGGLTLSGAGRIGGARSTVVVSSTTPFAQGLGVHALELSWTVAGQALEGATPLRIYTTYRAPIQNISRDVRPPNTKVHFENACRWANGAGQNIGQGSDSIAHQIDNQMRHFVHWEDIPSGREPAVADYPREAAKPINYDDLPGWVSSGRRGISSLYYPPLEPDQDYEEYEHYASNFGWWVLDNPTHTGGRCNQQASLVAGILGTVGIKAKVHYLARWGRARQTGRPVRMYFYSNDGSSSGGGPWNFHGVVLVDLADGTQHIYDGSFSSPPRRKNGSKEWAEGNDGPFIKKWTEVWVYDDERTPEGRLIRVPPHDIPTRWYGVQ